MCSLGAKEAAAMDSCFALVRARQHCIARHWTRHKVFIPVLVSPKGKRQLWASLNLSHQVSLAKFSLTQKTAYFTQKEISCNARIEMLCVTLTQKIDGIFIPWPCKNLGENLSLGRGNNHFLWCKSNIKISLNGVFCVLNVKGVEHLSICDWNWKTHLVLRVVCVSIQSVISRTNFFPWLGGTPQNIVWNP